MSVTRSSLLQKWKSLNIGTSKELGQNFLYDPKIVEKILQDENLNGKVIFEIGPGPGLLTAAILERNPKRLIAIEKDYRLIEFLTTNLAHYGDKFQLIKGNALYTSLASLGNQPITIISNLPYNISVKLLIQWLDELPLVQDMILMFQKEVAERIDANHATKAYGSLSVLVQWLCHIEPKFDLLPGSFYPPPKVSSSVLKITPRSQPLYPAERGKLEKLCQALFQTRRKMLRNSLKKFFVDPEGLMQQLHIIPTLRPEELTIEQFCKLSSFLE